MRRFTNDIKGIVSENWSGFNDSNTLMNYVLHVLVPEVSFFNFTLLIS